MNLCALSVAALSIVASAGTAIAHACDLVLDRQVVAPATSPDDAFGGSSALGGSFVCYAATSGEVEGLDAAGYVSVHDAETGERLHRLVSPSPRERGFFGDELALDGKFLAAADSLRVRVFNVESGELLHTLGPDDPDAPGDFGASIDIDDGLIVIGAPHDSERGVLAGAVYLFDAQSGERLAKLSASSTDELDLFGFAVAVSGDVIAVGALDADGASLYSGVAYVFDRSGAEKHTLLPGDGRRGFGSGIDTDGELVVVGLEGFKAGVDERGAAHVYDAATGQELIAISDGNPGDTYGEDVAIGGGRVYVGNRAPVGSPSDLSGAIYVHDAVTGERLQRLRRPGASAALDNFGLNFDIDEGRLAAGARFADFTGTAYLFEPDPLPMDLTGDGAVDATDLAILVAGWGTRFGDVDCDGLTDASDLAALIARWRR